MRQKTGRLVRATVVTAVTWACLAGTAAAQVWRPAEVPRRGAWEISGGGMWAGGVDFGRRAAELTPNVGQPSPFVLFDTESQIDPSFGAVARLGYYLTRSVALEAGFRYSRPTLGIRMFNDREEAAEVTVEEQLNRYVFEGALVYHLTPFAGGRARTFVTIGAGHLRELHAGDQLVETGRQYHAGGGVKYWFGRGARRRTGVRADVGVLVNDGGLSLTDRRRTQPFASGSVLYMF